VVVFVCVCVSCAGALAPVSLGVLDCGGRTERTSRGGWIRKVATPRT